MSTSTGTLQDRLTRVQERIEAAATRANRDLSSITIVGVSKTVGWTEIQAAYDAGLRHFGENRIKDARDRIPLDHPEDFLLHYIGQLQTNKVGQVLDLFDTVESVDRPSLIEELQKQAAKRDIILPVLLQVNVAGEEQKAGCSPDLASALAIKIFTAPNLRLDGLMTMAPLVDDPEDARLIFRGLRELRDSLERAHGQVLPVLSMGMSNDFPIAIEEGATHVRIGRAIFQP